MQLPPIAATTIGSFPRPNWLAQNERSRAVFRLEGAELKQAQDDATALSIHNQQRIGLDLLSDGEQRRTGFINHVLASFDGIDLEHEAVKTIYRRREQPRPVPRIVGKIKRRKPAIVEDLKFAKAQTNKPIKMDVPGPMTVVDSTLDEFYKGDEAAMAMDVAAAINEELRDLQAAGCDVLEIDEPAMTRYHEKVFAYGAKALDRCLEGITVPTVVHLCYGYPGGGGRQHEYEYPELLEELMKTKISRLRRRIRPQRLRSRGAGHRQRAHRHVRLRRPERHSGAVGGPSRRARAPGAQIRRAEKSLARPRLRPDDDHPRAGGCES